MTTIKLHSAIGDYTVDKVLSRDGGMSRVYLAYHHARPHAKVAVKVHDDSGNNQNTYQDLLRSEAANLSSLRHPGIVRIYPIKNISGRVSYSARLLPGNKQPWYFVMEYLAGGSLADHIARIGKSFPLLWIVELYYQILIIVQFVHRMGYGHCDLKPENILFRTPPVPENYPQPVLIDFGTLSKVGEPIAHPAMSLYYSPPEIIVANHRGEQNLQMDPQKVDIWMLGVIFFELVTGRKLFNKRHKKDISTSILKCEIDKISDLRPDANEYLDVFLKKVLSKNQEERPQIEELIVAIEEKLKIVHPPRL